MIENMINSYQFGETDDIFHENINKYHFQKNLERT